jgi:hypothetical protein
MYEVNLKGFLYIFPFIHWRCHRNIQRETFQIPFLGGCRQIIDGDSIGRCTYVCGVACFPTVPLQIYTYAVGLDLSDVCIAGDVLWMPAASGPTQQPFWVWGEIYCDNIGRDACGVAYSYYYHCKCMWFMSCRFAWLITPFQLHHCRRSGTENCIFAIGSTAACAGAEIHGH